MIEIKKRDKFLDIRITNPSVKELIRALKEMPQHLKVYLSVDEEQNALADDIIIVEEEECITFLPINPTMPEDL